LSRPGRSPIVARVIDLVLSPGRDRALRRRHPWVLSGAIERVPGNAAPGAFVRVLSAEGELLGYGHYSPHSSLRVRMLAFGKDPVDERALVRERLRAAIALRRSPLMRGLVGATDALRLANAEGDGLPGLSIDRYADVAVAKFTSAGMARLRDEVVAVLREEPGIAHAIERADALAARREQVDSQDRVLFGAAPAQVDVRERDRCYAVDLREGQKTGFYLDQRDARDLVERVARGRRALDLFCYSGGFAVAALRGGAESVVGVDASEPALALARANAARNGAGERASFERADAFEWVRRSPAEFDLLVVDPPPLARARRDVERASRAYKDVAMHALHRAAPGALALFFGCSHHVGPDLFRKILFGASIDARRPLAVLAELGAPADHPVSLDHPEGRYLTGLAVRVGERA